MRVVVIEASAPKAHPRVTLASASTLSGSVLRTLRGGEGLPNMFCLVAKGTQGVCGRVEEIGVGFQQWRVAGSQARQEDRVRSVANGHAIFGQ